MNDARCGRMRGLFTILHNCATKHFVAHFTSEIPLLPHVSFVILEQFGVILMVPL